MAVAEESGPIPPETRQLLAAAVRAAVGRIDDRKKAGDTIRHYENYPEIQTFEESGLPIFWAAHSGPLDYKSAFEDPLSLARAFGLETRPYEPPEEMPEWQAFLKLAESDPTLRRYFGCLPSKSLPDSSRASRTLAKALARPRSLTGRAGPLQDTRRTCQDS